MYGTFMKLYNIKQEGYKFSYSQLFQFLQVNHDILQMEFTDSKIAFKFTGNQATTDGQEHHLGVRWDLYPNNDRSVFYLKRGLTTSDNNESQSNSSKVGVMSATIQTDEQGVSNEATVGCGAVGADDSLPVGEVGNMFSTWLRISPIPVLISHNESFNIEISETDDMNDIVQKFKETYWKIPVPDRDDDLIEETHSKLINITDECFQFTVSQLMQLLCAFKGDFMFENANHQHCFLIFQVKGGERLRLLRLLVHYDIGSNSFSVIKSKEKVPGVTYRVTIPEDANRGPMFEKFLSLPEIIRKLNDFCALEPPPPAIHPSVHETYTKLMNLTKDVYLFSPSQLCQLLIVYRFCFRVYFIQGGHIGCRYKTENLLDHCPMTLLLKYSHDTGLFSVKNKACGMHNHDLIPYSQIVSHTDSQIPNENIQVGRGKRISPFKSAKKHITVEIPEDKNKRLSLDKSASLKAILNQVTDICENEIPQNFIHPSIYETYSKLMKMDDEDIFYVD
ncbi:unnamed protein product [Ambrosiozyma monospora]|uniref:Unnamed protein product n=1 Tax=Ambrosiozyma monospora TaxID=43982 RepID=A0ACB5TPS8_AMBMO|nr:unnamed protein product [Ambrosiozyma monospora]